MGQLVPGGKREDPISWRQEIGCSGKGIGEPFWDWRQKKMKRQNGCGKPLSQEILLSLPLFPDLTRILDPAQEAGRPSFPGVPPKRSGWWYLPLVRRTGLERGLNSVLLLLTSCIATGQAA